MESIAFPNMINRKTNQFNKVSNRDAVAQNLKLLILTPKMSLLGDPFYGINLQKLIFNPNDNIIKDIITDEIYEAVKLYMPQLTLLRNKIKIEKERSKLIISLDIINNIDRTMNLYQIPIKIIEE